VAEVRDDAMETLGSGRPWGISPTPSMEFEQPSLIGPTQPTSPITARTIALAMTVPGCEGYAFAATARASRLRACGVLRTSAFIFANRSALSGSPPAASQNSAAWSAKASG